LRFYGFKAEELLDEGEPNFACDIDPKTAWALRHPEFFPLDIDRAGYSELLRVPGVGVTGAGRIISTRRAGRIRPADLPRMGIVMKRARYFLCSGGSPLEEPMDPALLRVRLADSRSEEAVSRMASAMATKPQLEFSFA
jgi:predicted DNA-binding helix-hairpin-helix protein